MEPNDRVAEMLSHYFSTVFQAAGLKWDSDNDSEMRGLANAMLDMVRNEIAEHREQAPHIHPDGSSA